MQRRRHHKPLLLTDDERRTLEQWARRPTTAQRVARRSQIVLACADGLPNRAVAAQLAVSSNCVCKWRERFRVRRLAGLSDEPRPGVPRTVTDDRVVEVITRTLEAPPPTRTEWSTRSLGAAVGLSKATISRIWRTFWTAGPPGRNVQVVGRPAGLLKRCATLWACTSIPRTARSCSASTRKVRCRRWIARGPCCPCGRASRLVRRTTTFGTGPRPCLRRWTWPPGRSSASAIGAIGIKSF